MKTAIIHVGAPKTGSTSIQKAFATKEAIRLFSPHQIFYVPTLVNQLLTEPDWDYSDWRFAYALDKGDFIHHRYIASGIETLKDADNERVKTLHRYSLALRLEPEGVFVFSSEEFFNVGSHADVPLKEYLERLKMHLASEGFGAIRPVIYLRNIYELIEKNYLQSVKDGALTSLDDFVVSVIEDPSQYQLKDFVYTLFDVFSPTNCVVRDYNKITNCGISVVADFLEIVGLNPAHASLSLSEIRENSTNLNLLSHLMLLSFNRHYPFAKEGKNLIERELLIRSGFLEYLSRVGRDYFPQVQLSEEHVERLELALKGPTNTLVRRLGWKEDFLYRRPQRTFEGSMVNQELELSGTMVSIIDAFLAALLEYFPACQAWACAREKKDIGQHSVSLAYELCLSRDVESPEMANKKIEECDSLFDLLHSILCSEEFKQNLL